MSLRKGESTRLGLAYSTVEVVAYDPSWKAAATAHRDILASTLDGLAQNVEHIGSTAVPGLAAKPILDLAVRLVLGADPKAIVNRLTSAGYVFRGDKGNQGGLLFVCEPMPKVRTAHIHVAAYGDPQWDRYLATRDRLTADPSAAARYSAIKIALAQRYPDDRASYTAAKEAFLTELLSDLPAAETARPVVQRVRALLITPAGRLLAIRRTKPHQAIYWVLPGGSIEASDESLEAAAHREICEETGGHADLHRLVHIATVAGGSHAIFLGRIQQWDPALRSGPELHKPDGGLYDLEELDLDPATLSDGRLWPVPTAAWLAGILRTGADLFAVTDLRDIVPLDWEPRQTEYRRDQLPEPEAP